MVSPLLLGAVCGVSVVAVAVVIIIVYILYRKRHRATSCIASHSGYEAVGECKPPSLLSLTSGSQEISITKENRPVQPRSASMSTTSRGSLRSEQFTDDTSSLSAKSDASVDSLVFEANFGAIRPDLYPRRDVVLQQSSLDGGHGRLHTRLNYDFRTSDLVVHMIEAQDLPLSELLGGFSDPYIRIALVPSVDERIRQSSVKRKTSNPYYNERFKFPVAFDEVKDKLLVFHIYDYDKFSRHNVIGEVQIDLGKVEISNSVEMWCDIQKHQKASGILGELLVSLSYLPTAERLTVVIMKAKELTVSNNPPSADPYVRLTLLVEGKKIKRKKTSVIRGSTNPVWNEALTFNVPADVLPKVGLECCVMDHDLIGHGEIIGRCMLGPERPGKEGNHWNEMLHNQRKSNAMWHNLRK
ncbi:synaptotagmin-6-like isoform X2 [Haliotis asinina]